MGDGLTFGERLKKWFPRRKLISMAAVTLLYGLIYWWSANHRTGYFPEWLSRQAFWEYWVTALFMVAIGLWIVGPALALGCLAGIPIAQYLGDRMDEYYATVITPDMTAEQLAAYGPRHVYMWWLIIAVFLVTGLIAQLVYRVIRRRREILLYG